MDFTFGFGSQSLLVIDPGRHTIKVGIGALGGKGRWARLQSVYTVRTGAAPQDTPEEVIERSGELIREIVKRHGLSAKQVSFAIPGRVSFVRQLKIPKVSGDRLNRLIQYEARQQIPFPLEDIILDSHVFETGGPELGVTLVAIRKSTIDQFCDMLRTAGLVPDTIDVTTLSLFDAFYTQLKEEEEEMVALVDIGGSTTDMVVCGNNRVEFIRSAPQAGDQLTRSLVDNMGLEWEEAEELKVSVGEVDPSIDRRTDPLAYGEDDRNARVKLFLSKAADPIANEIRRTLDFYVSQPEGEPIGKIYLTGGTANCPGMAGFIESRLGIPCEVKNPFEKTLVNVDTLESEPLQTTSAILLGQCQRNIGDIPFRMNFLPPSIVRRKEFEKRRAILAAEGLLLALLIGISVVMVQRRIDVLSKATQSLSEKLEGKGAIAQEIKKYTENTIRLNDRFRVLQHVGRSRGVISRTMAAVAENLPLGEIWLTRIDTDTQNMKMYVSGSDPESVVNFKERIREVTRLRNPQITGEERQADGGIIFECGAAIEKNPSPEIRKLREKLENRNIELLELNFEDESKPTGSKQQCLITATVREPIDLAEQRNLVRDVLQAEKDAELGYQVENVVIAQMDFQHVYKGQYRIPAPQPELILKNEMDISDLSFIPPGQ